MLETVMLALSYPLRLMATHISVAFLKFVGVEVVAERTSINILAEGREIAVTDACSGIEQLGGLVIVGIVFAVMMQKRFSLRLLQWFSILPCVIVANTIRLIVTILLFRSYGEVILGDTWHISLGWAQTILAVTLLWLFGKLLQKLSNSPSDASPDSDADAKPSADAD